MTVKTSAKIGVKGRNIEASKRERTIEKHYYGKNLHFDLHNWSLSSDLGIWQITERK